jgi:hypothetical protein
MYSVMSYDTVGDFVERRNFIVGRITIQLKGFDWPA